MGFAGELEARRGGSLRGIHRLLAGGACRVYTSLHGEATEQKTVRVLGTMRRVVAIAKALSDESRVRALMALEGGELCLCQLIELLELAPSTVSKHMTVLQDALLVERRKQGRWAYYRLPSDTAPREALGAIEWVRASLRDTRVVRADAALLERVRRADLEELAACYRD